MQYRLQNMAMRATAWLAPELRALWLTTFYEFYRLVVRGQVEPWLIERARAPKASHFFLRLFPLALRCRIYAAAYVFRLHRKGHVLPGVLRTLEAGGGEKKRVAGLHAEDFPEWMQKDLAHLSEIEATLFPKPEFFARFHRWSPHLAPELGRLYASLLKQVASSRCDAILVAPWLREGGADKGILQYLDYYAKRFASVLLITTYPVASSRLSGVAPQVRVLEIGHLVSRLPHNDQALLLARLFLQLRPSLIHNVNSELCWRTYRRHGKAMRSISIRLVASIFIEERNARGERVGYSADYLFGCRKIVDAIVTDNRPGVALIEDRYGIDAAHLHAVHFYEKILKKATIRIESKPDSVARVLWASRVCDQKLPGLMLEIARRMPDVEFHMFGVIDSQVFSIEKELKAQGNIILHGGYSRFDDVVESAEFDLFVYTSVFDGVPNVLLEAGAKSLPIVAPVSVGGISDFADEATVFPVYDNRSVDEYVSAIRLALSDPNEAQRRAENARARVASEFSEQGFERGMDALVEALQLEGRDPPETASSGGSSLLPAEPADVVLVVPWVRDGGADKRILQYADYYRSGHRRLAVVTTLPHDSPWASKLPEGVALVEIGKAAERAGNQPSEDDLRGYLDRSGAKIVHVVQSDLGWRTIAKFGKALRAKGVRFVGSLFVREPLENGEKTGYADLYLGACRDTLDWVITDNSVLSKELIADFDVGECRVRTVHFWVHSSGDRYAHVAGGRSEKRPILWAGRICRQKNPALLVDIARRLAHREFWVYGEADDDAGHAALEGLKQCQNVVLKGRFDSFDQIAQQNQFCCFLYTTIFDGLPNVILEAAAAGIPIVSPASVGGLSDFVDGQTAFVVEDPASGADFAKNVERAISDPEQRRLHSEFAFNRVAEHFGREAFVNRMDSLFAAIGAGDGKCASTR